MDKSNNLVNDFTTLFSYLWYRDFPVDTWFRDIGGRADWTTHISMTFRGCADLMGYFTHFETGGRTDAVIKNNKKSPLVFAEWEWDSPEKNKINEFKKLRENSNKNSPEVCFLFIYYPSNKESELLETIKKEWDNISTPLLVATIYYSGGSTRTFDKLVFNLVKNNKIKFLRDQPALPRDVAGTRWEQDD